MVNPLRFAAFRRALRDAASKLTANRSLGRLLSAASAALEHPAAAVARLGEDVRAMLRMVREATAGHYRVLPKASLIAAIAGLIYFVDPLDLVPDLLPAVGYVDDAAVLLWVLKQLGLTQYGPEQLNFLRYRPVLSNERLKNEFGYTPQKTTREVFDLYLQSRRDAS